MALIKCSKCSAEISDKASCCPKCGAPIEVHKFRCAKCGNIISEEPCVYCAEMSKVVSDHDNASCDSNVNSNSEPEFVKKNKRNLKTTLGVCCIVFVLLFVGMKTGVIGGGGNPLVGEYIAQTALSDNLINFSGNGGFARFARTFGDWELVAGGKYTLSGSSLTLKCSDGRIWEFYYDRANDTLLQQGVNITFRRYS